MATIGRIAVIVAFVGALATLAIDFLVLKPAETKVKNDLDTTTQTLQNTDAKLRSTAKELDTTKKDLDATKTELATTKDDLTKAKDSLAEAEKKVADAENKTKELAAQVEAKDQKVAEMEKKLAEAPAQVEELKTKVNDMGQQIAAIEGEKKQLADKIVQQENEIKILKGAGDKVVLPEGLKGKILVYEKNWNFVVIDVGRKDGALENGEMTVFRNLKFVGKVKLGAVNSRFAIANVLPEWSKLEIQEGDVVIPSS